MDRTEKADEIFENSLENIYQGDGFYIGFREDAISKAYYLITMSGALVSKKIAMFLYLEEAQKIISSNGDKRVVAQIELEKPMFLKVISEEKNGSKQHTIQANTVNMYRGNSVEFVIQEGTLKRYTGASTEVVIPSNVTSIGNFAFLGCSSLSSITIPNSVTRIGCSAFAHCSGLTSITIPSSVTSIDEMAFENCSCLAEVIFLNPGTSVAKDAFERTAFLSHQYMRAGRCAHCGGQFKGFFTKVCSRCRRKKDY